MNTSQLDIPIEHSQQPLETPGFEPTVDVKTAARFLGVSPSLVYAYVERKQIPHFRMMGRSIRFAAQKFARNDLPPDDLALTRALGF
jgi:excisionase family DNA binding protein